MWSHNPKVSAATVVHGAMALGAVVHTSLSKDRVDSLVADLFFVVEGADVGGDECFDAVSESSRCFAEGDSSARIVPVMSSPASRSEAPLPLLARSSSYRYSPVSPNGSVGQGSECS